MANYSISYELGKPNKLGLCQLYLRLLLDRKKILIKQSYKIHSKISKEEKFLIDKICLDAQKKIISFVNAGGEISPINLKNIFAENIASANTIVDYLDAIEDRLKSRFSENRVKGYGTLRNKISQITPDATFQDISMEFLEKFESSLKKQKRNVKTEIINGEKKVQYINLSHNYVAQLMSVFVAVLNRAHKDGIIEKEKFVDYNPQPEKYDIPEYLTENEINKLYQLSDIIDDPNKQICAKYFLLGCHTGLRLMDLINFDKKRVSDERIALRADKNGRIISMPIYPRLRELIEFVISHPFPISEQKFRENIKKLCKLIGVKDRNIKIHTARHSFAMLLMGKGFTSDEVAEYLGDSPEVARVYARISAKLLDTKLMDAMHNIGK